MFCKVRGLHPKTHGCFPPPSPKKEKAPPLPQISAPRLLRLLPLVRAEEAGDPIQSHLVRQRKCHFHTRRSPAAAGGEAGSPSAEGTSSLPPPLHSRRQRLSGRRRGPLPCPRPAGERAPPRRLPLRRLLHGVSRRPAPKQAAAGTALASPAPSARRRRRGSGSLRGEQHVTAPVRGPSPEPPPPPPGSRPAQRRGPAARPGAPRPPRLPSFSAAAGAATAGPGPAPHRPPGAAPPLVPPPVRHGGGGGRRPARLRRGAARSKEA